MIFHKFFIKIIQFYCFSSNFHQKFWPKKKFGKNSQIEGLLNQKDNVLLAEDLMTDGGSKLKFLDAIEKLGANVSGIFVVFNYGIIKYYYLLKKKKN